MSKVRQNFHTTSEAMINKQINMELTASYVYLAMVSPNSPHKKINFKQEKKPIFRVSSSSIGKL